MSKPKEEYSLKLPKQLGVVFEGLCEQGNHGHNHNLGK